MNGIQHSGCDAIRLTCARKCNKPVQGLTRATGVHYLMPVMKTLLIFRHAQAVHFGDTSDHDRPLTEKGVLDAQRMGRLLRGLRPEQVLSSTAKRAVTTAELALRTAERTTNIQCLRQLYDSDIPQHLELLRQVASAVNSLLIVGHNPTFEHLASALVHRPVPMKTGSLAIVALPIDDWSKFNDSLASQLVGLFYPAMLRKRTEENE